MSVLSHTNMSVNKEVKKPIYKDYTSFLDSYKNGKKEDSCHSLTNSSNNSSTSINSDQSNEQTGKGFKEYVDKFDNKKFRSVQPNFLRRSSEESKKTVKTEIFININNDNSKYVNNITKVFENTKNENNAVGLTANKFEKNSNSQTITANPVSTKVSRFNSQPNETDYDSSEQKISVEDISKKFQVTGDKGKHTTLLKKQNSIKEKSKIFENNGGSIEKNKKHFINGYSVSKNNGEGVFNKPKGALPPKPPVMRTESVENTKIESKRTNPDTVVLSPPPISPLNIPPPPPLLFSTEIKEKQPILSQSPPPPPPPNFQNSVSDIPLPPPPPPMNFTVKITPASPTFKSPINGTNENKSVNNGFSTLPRMNKTKHVDGTDGIPVPTLDKNDPKVKRLVYGALRDMYGAYHDQANDYLATLPKNRVRKNNGLDNIIHSIA